MLFNCTGSYGTLHLFPPKASLGKPRHGRYAWVGTYMQDEDGWLQASGNRLLCDVGNDSEATARAITSLQGMTDGPGRSHDLDRMFPV